MGGLQAYREMNAGESTAGRIRKNIIHRDRGGEVKNTFSERYSTHRVHPLIIFILVIPYDRGGEPKKIYSAFR